MNTTVTQTPLQLHNLARYKYIVSIGWYGDYFGIATDVNDKYAAFNEEKRCDSQWKALILSGLRDARQMACNNLDCRIGWVSFHTPLSG